MTVVTVKHVCDRCGASISRDTDNNNWFPKDWQNIRLGQTGANIDLCNCCNDELFEFLSDRGAEGMGEACYNKGEVL